MDAIQHQPLVPPSATRSFDEVAAIDVDSFLKGLREANIAHQTRLEVLNGLLLVAVLALTLFACYSFAYDQGWPIVRGLSVAATVLFIAAMTYERQRPFPQAGNAEFPCNELLAILSNGRPELLSSDLLTACRRLAAEQSGRLLRSQFERLQQIDKERRLQAILINALPSSNPPRRPSHASTTVALTPSSGGESTIESKYT